MKFIELLKTAWQSLKVNPKRSFLTMIGIIIGIAAVITIIALGNGVKKQMIDSFKTTGSGEQTTTIEFMSTDPNAVGFKPNDILAIEQNFSGKVQKAQIDTKTTGIQSYAQFGNATDTRVTLGVTTKPIADSLIVEGKNFTQQTFLQAKPQVLITKALAKREYKDIESAIGTPVFINNTNYIVAGIYRQNQLAEATEPTAGDVIVPKEVYFANGTSNTQGNSLKLTIAKGENASKVTNKVVDYLKKNATAKDQGEYSFFDLGSMLEQLSKVMDTLTLFISAIAGISLFIAGIGVMNMMYISVSERTQEIGIRLAIGATPSNILLQFLLEAIMLTVSGGLIGFGFGWLFAHAIAKFIPGNITAVVTFNSFLLAFGVSTAVGVIFGILPARQAANKNLIDILR